MLSRYLAMLNHDLLKLHGQILCILPGKKIGQCTFSFISFLGHLKKTFNVQQIRFQWDLASWFEPISGYFMPKFQSMKVWDTPFSYALFVFYCLTIENLLKMPSNQSFRLNEFLKLNFFNFYHLSKFKTPFS